jgi:hypothetical protein
MFTIATAAGRTSSSAIVWASYILQFYVLPFKMLAKHCLVLMPAYKNYPFVDLTLFSFLLKQSRVLLTTLGWVVSKWCFNLLGSMHSDAEPSIHRTHCGLSSPTTSIDVKQKIQIAVIIFSIFTLLHALATGWRCALLFTLSQRLLSFSKNRSIFLKGIWKKILQELHLITTIFSWYDLRKRPFTEASPNSN